MVIAERTQPKLDFEIDETQSQVRVGDGHKEVRRIFADIQLRCLKEIDRDVTVRSFHLSLHRSQSEAEIIEIKEETSQVSRSVPAMEIVPTRQVWKVTEDSEDRLYQFFMEITPKLQASLSPDYFLRVTMEVAGQEPISKRVYVKNWAVQDCGFSPISLKPFEEYPIEAQKEIAELKDDLASLQKTIEELGRFNQEYEWLTTLARQQSREIDKWVKVKNCERGDLNLYVPFGDPQNVILCVWVTNKSRLDISLSDDLGGLIKFQEMELKDTKEVINHVTDLPSGETACLTIKQRLTPSEVQAIINAEYSARPQFYNFDKLQVTIVGGKSSPDIKAKTLQIGSAFANAYPIDLLERGQRLRALSEIRGGAVQLSEHLRIETNNPVPKEVIEQWATTSQGNLKQVYKTKAAMRLWTELTHGYPIPESAPSQRQWLEQFFIVLGAILASEYGEYIRRNQDKE